VGILQAGRWLPLADSGNGSQDGPLLPHDLFVPVFPAVFTMRILLFVFCLMSSLAWGAAYTPESVPNQRQINGSHVADPDEILDAEDKARMDQLLVSLEQQTGAQVAVVVLDSIGQSTVFDFAQALFVKWGIGSKERNDGLLVLLVRDQRTVRMHTGYGLEGALPDALCKRIQHDFMLPAFKQGDFGAGLLAGLGEVARVLSDPAQALAAGSDAPDPSDWEDFRLAAMVIGLIAVLLAFGIKSVLGHFSSSRKEKNRLPEAMRWTRKSWLAAFALGPGLLVAVFDQLRPASPVLGCLVALYAYFGLLVVVQAGRQQLAVNRLLAKKDYFSATKLVGGQSSFWGWMALYFPLPFLGYYLFQRSRQSRYRNMPRHCPKCRAVMRKLGENEEDRFLSQAQQMEESLHSADHDVWLCGECGATARWVYPGTESKYGKCPSCKSLAYYLETDHTLVPASYDSRGKGETIHVCKFCGTRKSETYSIARLTDSSSSSSSSDSSSSSSSGSSWGGGDSGGGGSSDSW